MRAVYLSILSFCITGLTLFAQATPDHLRCEHLINPLGIDTPSPRLSWQLNDTRYGAAQTAYRIIIGTDSAAVAGGRGEIWDTRQVTSDGIQTTYAGSLLVPFTRYFWSVRVWDRDGWNPPRQWQALKPA